jgi:serine/threonine protein kinase
VVVAPVSAIEIPGYKILKTLGVGGQATVYLAVQQGFDREVALKVMSPALAADPTFGERFIREAKIVAKLSHARIVTVYDVGESGSFYYLAMEYMRGEELKTRISKGLKAKDALLIIAKLAQALHFAHKKGYIHRDVKSENILFDEDEQPVLTDFGIAKASNSSTQMTQTGKLIGTPEYMSPEQCRGKKLDGRSDLYSLGIILFEMLNRSVPFTGEDSVAVCIQHVTKPVPRLPARYQHLQWVIDALLAKNPNERFQSGKELAIALKEFLTSGAVADKGSISTSKTRISQVLDKEQEQENSSDDPFGYEDDYEMSDGIELSDNFSIDQRINVKPESSSRFPIVIVSFLLIALGGAGYAMRYDWVPQVQKAMGVEWVTLADENKDIKEEKLDSNTPSDSNEIAEQQTDNKAVSENIADDTPKISRVAQLIQQADTLAQYSPHQLTDIQQALDNLITAKSLEPDNPDVTRIKLNIVEIALSEAVSSAEQQLFKSAQQWIDLVEFTDRENSKLEETKNTVNNLIANHQKQQGEQQKQNERFEQLIAATETALKNSALTKPVEKNAVYFLGEAITINSQDERIAALQSKIETKFVSLINQRVKNNRYNQATTLLNQLTEVAWVENSYDDLRQQISSKKQRFNTAVKEQQKLAAIEKAKQEALAIRKAKLADPLVQMKLQSNLEAAQYLLESNNLVEPFGNNALEKFKAALEVDPENELARKGVDDIKSTILSNLDVAISNNIKTSAELWLAKLVIFNPGAELIDSYTSEVSQIVEPVPTEQPVDNNKGSAASGLELVQDAETVLTDENSPVTGDAEAAQEKELIGNAAVESEEVDVKSAVTTTEQDSAKKDGKENKEAEEDKEDEGGNN